MTKINVTSHMSKPCENLGSSENEASLRNAASPVKLVNRHDAMPIARHQKPA